MKVFHLMSGAPYGGVERQAMRLAGVLQKNGVEQRAMFPRNPARAKQFEALGVDAVEMDFPSRFAFLDRRRINGVIVRFAPDIVISWTPDVAELVPVGDAISMAEAIKMMSADPELGQRLTAAGRKAFDETFAMDKVAPQYLHLLSVLTGKPPGATSSPSA